MVGPAPAFVQVESRECGRRNAYGKVDQRVDIFSIKNDSSRHTSERAGRSRRVASTQNQRLAVKRGGSAGYYVSKELLHPQAAACVVQSLFLACNLLG